MTIQPLSNVNQTLFSNSVTGGNNNTTATTSTTATDSSQISPFAQLMSTLQQLQQTNPTEFKQVTSTLASDLQAAATNAQNNGNAAEADSLNQLAAAFNQSSQTGQLPGFLQQGANNTGASGHHHHHHHGGGHGLGQDLNSISQSLLSSLPSGASAGTSTNANSGNTQQ